MLVTNQSDHETAGLRPSPGRRLAALDLGTNNCRLLVAEPCREGFRVVDSFSRIVRLGEGLAANGALAEPAMDRTLAALRVCRRIMDRHRVVRARCVATDACRRARNGPPFIRTARPPTGVDLEVLGHEEEARLALLGCLALIDPSAERLMMLDIGGGSTEIMWLDRRMSQDQGAPGHSLSMPLGVVTLSETFGGAADDASYARMVEHTARHLAQADRLPVQARRADTPGLQMLGTSGTVTTLAAVHLGLRRYDRRKVDGISLPFSVILKVARSLRELDEADRAAHPCIGQDRADLMVAGCAILEAIHRRWPVDRLQVADRGLREGILNALVGRSLGHALRPAREPG